MPDVLHATTELAVLIPPYELHGDLVVPQNATGLVIFAHGSGSSRKSSRNLFVARDLNQGGLATLLLDLLTEEEERLDIRTGELRFNIGLLSERLVAAAEWSGRDSQLRHLTIGYFGASTGGGAALVAAAYEPEGIGAVVSRGGRPDLAGDALAHVAVPTLLIVGGEDHPVIRMNERAMRALQCEKRMETVPGATHLFEEPGALERVAELARDWFQRHLARRR